MSPKTTRLLVIILLVLGLCLTIFFGMRAVRSFMRFRRLPPQPQATDVTLIRGWMTIGYIAHTYRVPAEYLVKAIGAEDPKYFEMPLSDLNQQLHPGQPGVIMQQVQQAITDFWAAHPPPPAPPTAPAAPTGMGPGGKHDRSPTLTPGGSQP